MCCVEELNKALVEVCTASVVDYTRVEQLLAQGAQPLGCYIDEYNCTNVVYDEITDYYIDVDFNTVDFLKITELFLQHGMNIRYAQFPFDDDRRTPLWTFAFYSGENTIKALKLLMDHGLDADAADECWSHAIFDWFNVYPWLSDEFSYEMLYDTLKKVMLIAAYPHVLENASELQEIIQIQDNTYDVSLFRNWDLYEYEVVPKETKDTPTIFDALVTIKRKGTNEVVWKFILK